MKRMEQLYEILAEIRCAVLVEIGVYQGRRARRMAKAAFRKSPAVTYYGFDLFEGLTPEDLRAESSLQPLSRAEIAEFLQGFAREAASRPLWLRREFSFELVPGYTSDTLPAFCEAHPDFAADFVFIDGGHSVATIENDWRYCSRMVRPGGILCLDDYYEDPEHIREFGCNQLVERLRDSREWRVSVLPVADPHKSGGTCRIARIDRIG